MDERGHAAPIESGIKQGAELMKRLMMQSDSVFCTECGITLRPFMRICPRCGAVREEATPMRALPLESAPAPVMSEPQQTTGKIFADSAASAIRADDRLKTEVTPLEIAQRHSQLKTEVYSATPINVVLRPPEDAGRRFPLFTTAQWALMAIGAGLMILMLVIAYLLWRQQQREMAQAANRTSVAAAQPTPVASPTPAPGPTPTATDDQVISESVKSQLMAYNPLGFSRYSFEVKEGIVTIEGEVEHQPEKDGVENVLRMVAGVNKVVNHLKVKPEQPLAPVKLNLAEAKILDDALRREIASRRQVASVDPLGQGDRSRQTQLTDPGAAAREKAAAKLREEEAALRKAAEEKLRREAEEFERRQEELRRAETERRAMAEQARLMVSALRSGTVAWSGMVDGVDEVVISGSSASVRHLNGKPPREVKASFSAQIPRSPVSVALISTNGRGVISVVQQPSAANGFTTIVRVDDSARGGDKRYEFTLRWSAQ